MKSKIIIVLILLAVSFIFMSGCATRISEVEKIPEGIPEVLEQPPRDSVPLPTGRLGDLCTGEEECRSFCQANRAQCEEYCKGNENELCEIIFPPEEDLEKEVSIISEEVKVDDKKCAGTKTKFDYAPVNLEKTELFLPLGLMTGDHVGPIDHHYFQNFDNHEFDIEVYSPGSGIMTEIGHMPGAKAEEDYRIVIQHTCTLSSVYIYVSHLPEKIKKHLEGRSEGAYVEIPVQAGELIGYYKNNLDYNLVDEEVVLTGFVIPEHYRREPWKIHVPSNTYDYFNEPIKSKLMAKSVRTAEPLSGKIDYDIDGKLVGNWFLEGIDNREGIALDDWNTHLTLAYDYLDPQKIVISIGGYGGEESRQFGVKGNSPDPAQVGMENGLIEYELVEYDYLTPHGNYWDRTSLVKGLRTTSNEMVQGVVLVQMITDRKIKFEAFPGKAASQVTRFTSEAKRYER